MAASARTARAVAGVRPGYAHVCLVAVSLWLAACGYLPQATRLAAEAVADAARMRGSDGKFHCIDLVGVPWLVISDELSCTPNGGYAR